MVAAVAAAEMAAEMAAKDSHPCSLMAQALL